jgi:pyrroloquinoline quinone biosynthesis protein B
MNPFAVFLTLCIGLFTSCSKNETERPNDYKYELTVLGVAQDGGYPQTGCGKVCCQSFEKGKETERYPACLALFDNVNKKVLFFETTPSYPEQWRLWRKSHPDFKENHPDAFFITHAHVGHYTGLIHLGREVMGSAEVPVFVLPRMFHFLENNGPWSQLVSLKNIRLNLLKKDSAIQFSEEIKITPLEVPHRDEYSETAGFRIEAGGKIILFIPDIDKWHLWNRDIKEEITNCDLAFLDATFYKNGELKRDMSEIPHPFVEESMKAFESLSKEEKRKIHFIHFNHTNPLIWDNEARKAVENQGYQIAKQGESIFW